MTLVAPAVIVALALATQQEGGTSAEAPAERMVKIRAAFDDLACDVVVMHAAFVENDKRTTPEELREALFRDGYCHAVLGNVAAAGERFSQIVAADPEAKPPFEMEERIQYLFNAARAEQLKRIEEQKKKERDDLKARVSLDVTTPTNLVGGERAIFVVKIGGEKASVVRSMRIDFQKEDEPELYGLPIVKQKDGTWRGEIPGAYTRSKIGVTLRWFITASDDVGEVAHVGSREAPNSLFVSAGLVASDMKVSERMAQNTRLVLGVLGTPTAAAISFFAALPIAGGVVDLAQGAERNLDDGDEEPGEPPLVMLGYLTLALLPPALAVGASYLVLSQLVDGFWLQVAVPAAGALLFTGWMVAVMSGRPNRGTASDILPKYDDAHGLEQNVAVASAVAAFVSSIAGPIIVVAIDAPTDE